MLASRRNHRQLLLIFTANNYTMKKLLLLTIIISLIACENKPQFRETNIETEPEVTQSANSSHHIPEISQVFAAHGGYDTWFDLKMLSYDMGGNTTLVELQHRYIRTESEEQTVGFGGEKVWVYPASEDADQQKMRYNLMFYFYAFPFVAGDPGVNYEVLSPIILQSKVLDSYHPFACTIITTCFSGY